MSHAQNGFAFYNKFDIAGIALLSLGALCFMLSGRKDAEEQIKRREQDTWTKATRDVDDSTMGVVPHVPVKHHGSGTPGDAA